jgi:PAS domain S-box-containing protein
MINFDNNNEYVLTQQDIIVTKTDLKGFITYVNDDLLRITGFSEQELIGERHNIFRHADMPAEVFKDLWRTILSECTWRGVVKNKTKEGGFYWVHADVTPLYQNKVLVGFMSVRIKPTEEEINKAKIIYMQMNAGIFKSKLLFGDIVQNVAWTELRRKFDDVKISTKFSSLVAIGIFSIMLLAALDHSALNNVKATLEEVQTNSHEINLEYEAKIKSLEYKLAVYEPKNTLDIANLHKRTLSNEQFHQIKTRSNQVLSDLQNRNMFIVLVVLVVLVLLYELIIRSIVNPLKEAQEGLRELSNGVYHFPINYRSKNELGKMMEALRTTAVRLGFEVANDKKINAEIIKVHEKNHALNAQINQLQRIESIGRMTAGLAHNFNNILGAIIGYNQLNLFTAEDCKEESIKQEIVENAEQIQTASKRAVELVKHMMSYSNQNSENYFELDVKPASEVINEVLELMRPSLTNLFQIHTDIDNELVIEIASNKLHQILINLIMNARDAIEGRGLINVTLKKISVDNLLCNACLEKLNGEFIELCVSDNGTGIEQNVMTHIFDPFFTTKPVGEGTGLGLSTVSGMVHEAHGHIIVESKTEEPNKGTNFRLIFSIK